MMSASDGPTIATASMEAGVVTPGVTSDDGNTKQIWKCLYLDLDFVRSIYGVLVAAEMILSLIGLISVSVPKNESCAFLYSSTYSYYEFTASSCFIVSLLWYGFYALGLPKKIGFVRWDIAEMAWCAFYIFNYLIASSVIAAHACLQGGYKAAAAFGFICLIVLIANGIFVGRQFYDKHCGSGRGTGSSAQPGTEPEENKY